MALERTNDTLHLSKTEKTYAAPVLIILRERDIPIEVMRGLLFFFEGKINWKMDKGEMRRVLRRYLKYEGNTEKLVDAIKKTILNEPGSSQDMFSNPV